MKTIKQLERELKILRENKGDLGENARFATYRYLEGQSDSLKEVLKEIDDGGSFIIGGEPNEDFIKGMKYLAEGLKAKLVGK